MNANLIIGYVVQCEDGLYVHKTSVSHILSSIQPDPISRPDAYRRLAGFLEENPTNTLEYTVAPVYREYTPLENASKELGNLLMSLCRRHHLELGLTQEQVEAKIGQELVSLGADGSTF